MPSMRHSQKAVKELLESADKPCDARTDHRRMIAEADKRQWRVLKLISAGLGRHRIAKALGCHRSSILRSQQLLWKTGYVTRSAGKCGAEYHVTPKGAEKLEEMGDG